MRVRRSSSLLGLFAAALLLCTSARGSAQVERFALVVGNNRGLGHEGALRYAEADARKVHATLRDVGDFAPHNVVLLEAPSAETMRRALIDLNDRVRNRNKGENARAVLLVYYSGHADAEDLHLGETRFAISRRALTSSADARTAQCSKVLRVSKAAAPRACARRI